MAGGSRGGGRVASRALRAARAGAPYGLGLILGLLALGPALKPGFTLAYDMVFVPDPPITAATFGMTGTLPRAVPSDTVVALLGTVLPADLVQKVLLLAIFVLASAGAAAIVPGQGMAARLAAGAFYAWNPFVAERLLIGQWAFLLGYAGLPWAVRAAARLHRPGSTAGLVRALIPAAIGGFTPMIVTAITVLCVAFRRGPTAAVKVLGVCGVLSLPWLVPSLLRPGGVAVDPAGVAAFAARADTPFGGVGSLFLLGGIWNAETVPAGYGDLFVSTLRLLIAVAAVVAVALLLRGRNPYNENPCLRLVVGGLVVAGGVGFGIACLGLTEPGRGVLRSLTGVWPGFAVLRDAQQYVAPLALLQAAGIGLLVAFAAGRTGARDRSGWAFAVFGVVAPVLLLPSLAWGAGGRLGAAAYPGEWGQVRAIVAADRVAGDVLALPWAAHRRYAWNDGRTVLDPMPRFLPRRVVADDAVQVGNVRLAPEDPRAATVPALLTGTGDLTERLNRAGFRYVIVDAGGPPIQNVFHRRLANATRVHDGPELTAYRLVTPAPSTEKSPPAWAVGAGFGITFATILWSLAISGSSLLPRSRVLREESL